MKSQTNAKKVAVKLSAIDIYSQTFCILRETPAILFLFTLLAVFDFAALTILFFSHSEPISLLVAPIIRSFWGSRFLHYPDNFLLLPKLFNYAHLVILSTFGILFTGIIINKIKDETEGKSNSILSLIKPVLKCFFPLLIIWAITYFVYSLIVKKILPYFPPQPILQLTCGYILGVLVQAISVYFIPAILILEKGFFSKLKAGLVFGFSHLGLTISIVGIPTFFIVLTSAAKILTPYFVSFHPEIVLIVLSVGIVVSVMVDMFITTATTLLFLKER